MTISQSVIDEIYNKASRLQREGYGKLAEKEYLELLEQQPDHVDALLQLGRICRGTGEVERAIEYANKAIELSPESSAPVELLGTIYMKVRKFDDAINCFNKVNDMGHASALNYCNMAMVYAEQREYSEAVKYADKSQEMGHDNTNINDALSTIFFQAGELQKCLALAIETVNSRQYSVHSMYNVAFSLFSLGRYDDLMVFIGDLEGKKILHKGRMGGIHILACTACYVKNDQQKLEQFLGKIYFDKTSEHMPFPKESSLKPYLAYILRLTEFRQNNVDIYLTRDYDKKLYLVGDSHSISPAFSYIDYSNELYRCYPCLVMGAQARHLSVSEINEYKSAFEVQLKGVPSNSKVVFMFGEIDCRVDTGILPYHKKTGQLDEASIGSTIAEITNGYIDYLVDKVKERNLDASIYGVPACNFDFKDYEDSDKELVQFIIKNFNQELAKKAASVGLQFIDIYSQTADESGGANQDKYIDMYHTNPTVFAEVINQDK